MKVSVVIPAWNGARFLPACLEALYALGDPDLDVVVVDNASADGSADLVAARYPAARLLRHAENLGFARACNAGLRAAAGEVLVLLNQDTVVRPAWLTALRAAFTDQPQAGIVGCKALYPDGRVQHAGGWMEWPLGVGHHYGHAEPDDGRWDEARAVDFVTGAALGLRRAVLERIGYLDEDLRPAYFEDVDYCLRARAAGFLVWYAPAAVLEHHESTSTAPAARSRYYQRNRLRLVLKHLPPDRFLAEFVPAERERLPLALWSTEGPALRAAYLESVFEVPALLRAHGPVARACQPPVTAALLQLYREAWAVDWQVLAEKAAVAAPLAPEPGEDPSRVPPGRYPAAAPDLFPDYVSRVAGRRAGAPASEAPWLDFKEYRFQSGLPLIGPALARLRAFFFSLAGRWAMLYLMQQQEMINRRHAEYLNALGQRVRELADENAALAERLAGRNDKE